MINVEIVGDKVVSLSDFLLEDRIVCRKILKR